LVANADKSDIRLIITSQKGQRVDSRINDGPFTPIISPILVISDINFLSIIINIS
jgi:hypothetical protein